MDDEPQSWTERATFYRCRALDALKHAGEAKDGRQRDQCLQMAQSWYALAVQIEDQMVHLPKKDAAFAFLALDVSNDASGWVR